MLGQPTAHQLSPYELESVSPALVAVPIFSHLPVPRQRPEEGGRWPHQDGGARTRMKDARRLESIAARRP